MNKKTLFVNNNGESTRDFIHVDEVCEIYQDLINNKNNLICDVGNGYGYKIKDIINAIGKNKFRIKNINITEQSSSIAQTDYKLKNINLEKYIRINLNIKKKLAIDKITFKNYQLLIKKKIKGSIIYGAGNAGKQVCDLLLKNSKDAVYCFVDDDKKSWKILQRKNNYIKRGATKFSKPSKNSQYYFGNSIFKWKKTKIFIFRFIKYHQV